MEFKIPTPVLPTDEEMTAIANDWWKNHIHINFRDWNDTLRKHSFEFRVVDIGEELMNETIALENDATNFDSTVAKYEALVNPVLKELQCEDNFFFKLITRSPKDIMESDEHGKPKQINAVKDIVISMISSMRCFEDLCLLRYLPNPCIVIRPFIQFEAYEEWRVFVSEKKIKGITQYYYNSEFPELSIDAVRKADFEIRKIINEVAIPNLKIDDFVADVIVRDRTRQTSILEINPYGLSDPCLFFDYVSFDGNTIWNYKGDTYSFDRIKNIYSIKK